MVVGLILGLVFFLVPSDAFAWGPAAHVHFGLGILDTLPYGTGLLAVIANHPEHFLYGVLLPDIAIGKSAMPKHRSGHQWRHGFLLLEHSQNETEKAFALGYLSHLASDVIAHTQFLPDMIRKSPTRRLSSHFYWESRFDTRIRRLDPTVDALLAKLLRQRFAAENRLFERFVPPALLPHRLAASLFRGSVILQNQPTLTRLASRYDLASSDILPNHEVEAWGFLAMAAGSDILMRLRDSHAITADPNGNDAIPKAKHQRRFMTKRLQQNHA